ncbi:PRC-barrel domain-containing protein [Streptomyces sp. SCSIO 30461]
MQTDIDPRSLIGRKAFDRNGTKIGTVDEVYLDDATGVPEWAAVRTGLFSRDAFVPLEPSELATDGLHIPFERALIKDAPDFGVGRHLSPEQELQLYHHYGLDLPTPSENPTPPPPAPSGGGSPAPGAPGDRDFGRLAGNDDREG